MHGDLKLADLVPFEGSLPEGTYGLETIEGRYCVVCRNASSGEVLRGVELTDPVHLMVLSYFMSMPQMMTNVLMHYLRPPEPAVIDPRILRS